MYKTKLCMGTSLKYGTDIENQISLLHKAGFEGFFTPWDKNIAKYRKIADKLGMIYQSVHAPFMNAAKMWQGDSEGREAVDELVNCLKDCARYEVPIMVMHTYIGFEDIHDPAGIGIENFSRVVEEAHKLNVKIAFENTEGEVYLSALMEHFKDCGHVGFCWDTGHELCYNRGKDMTALYGDRLIATHLNDNLGISDFDGKIIWTDDLHLLPFDGISDWNSIVDRLNKCGYDDILTFELSKTSMPGRHDNDKYTNMSIEEYFAEAYSRAAKVALLKRKNG